MAMNDQPVILDLSVTRAKGVGDPFRGKVGAVL